MNKLLINLFLTAGLTICVIAAIIILLPALVVAGVLVFAMLPLLAVGIALVLMASFIDLPSEYSYCRDKKGKKK